MSATDIAKSVDVDLDLIQEQAASVAEELIAAAKMKEGQILVVGCSSSEIAAHAIGCYSSKEGGEPLLNAHNKATRKHRRDQAAQCGRRLLLHRRLEWICLPLRRGADPGPRRH